MSLWDTFKDEFTTFATRGETLDLAVGTIIGAGVTPVANSVVEDIVMPPIGILLGKADLPNQFLVIREGEDGGPYKTLKAANEDGAVTINYGRLINRSISLVVILLVAFAIVKGLNQIRAAQKKKQLEEQQKQLEEQQRRLQQQQPPQEVRTVAKAAAEALTS